MGKKILEAPMSLISGPPMMTITQKMMPKSLPSVNKKRKLMKDCCNKKKMLKILSKKRPRPRKKLKKKSMTKLFHLVDKKICCTRIEKMTIGWEILVNNLNDLQYNIIVYINS